MGVTLTFSFWLEVVHELLPRAAKAFLCPPTYFCSTVCLECLCSPSVGPCFLPVPPEQRQVWPSFPHPPTHRLVSSGRNRRHWSHTWTAGCSSQLHIRARHPDPVTGQHKMPALKPLSFSHRKPPLGKGVQHGTWDQISRHTHTHTPPKGAHTLFEGKSSHASYKWVVVITQNTGIANHTIIGASDLLSQRDARFPKEQRAVLTCSLYS